jgi:hypothetical protein
MCTQTTYSRIRRAAVATVLVASPAAMAQSAAPPVYGPVVGFRTSDGLKVDTAATPIRVLPAAAHPDVLLVTRATPSRNGPDAGAVLVYASVQTPGARGGLARAVSVDQGRTWSQPETVVINGWPRELESRWPVNPAAVQLEDGRIRLFFTLNARPADRPTAPGRPADRPSQASAAAGSVYSAISNDGLTFAVEDGVRFDLIGAANVEVLRLPDPPSTDTRRLGPWLMFLTREDHTVLAVSKDGLSFERDPTFALTSVESCTAAPAKPEAREVRLWGTDRTGVVSALFDPATGDVRLDPGVRIAATDGRPADPGAAPAGDGVFLLVCTRKTADKPTGPTPPDRRPEPRDPFRQPLSPPTQPEPKPPPDIRPPTIDPEPQKPK